MGIALLSGCAAIGGVEPTRDTYDLVAPDVSAAEPVRRGVQVLIAEPVALRALDSENIVVETGAFAIQYLDGAQWSDRLTRLVQRRLAEAFESADRFTGIGVPGQGLAIDFQLVTNIRTFGIDAGADTARVRIDAKLLDDTDGVVVASRTFDATVPVSSASNPDTFVAALNRAFSAVASDMVVWVSRLI